MLMPIVDVNAKLSVHLPYIHTTAWLLMLIARHILKRNLAATYDNARLFSIKRFCHHRSQLKVSMQYLCRRPLPWNAS